MEESTIMQEGSVEQRFLMIMHERLMKLEDLMIQRSDKPKVWTISDISPDHAAKLRKDYENQNIADAIRYRMQLGRTEYVHDTEMLPSTQHILQERGFNVKKARGTRDMYNRVDIKYVTIVSWGPKSSETITDRSWTFNYE